MVDLVYTIRGERVMLDRDLAALFDVETRQINQQVKRNPGRFGEGYSFKLNTEEFRNLRSILKSQKVISNWGGTRYSPTAFTEKGIYMLSTVLRSGQADLVVKHIIEIFTETNRVLAENSELKQTILSLEQQAARSQTIIKTLSLIAQEIHRKNMDPTVIIAAITATMDAIELWRKFRNKEGAQKAISQVESLRETEHIQEEARKLKVLIRPDILDTMENRVQTCMDRYKKILESDEDYLPEEIDKATDALLSCVCRELKRIQKVNGSLPDGILQDYWKQYRCED